MHDAQGFGDELIAQLPSPSPAGDLFLYLQPRLNQYQPERETTQIAVERASVVQSIAGRARLLNAEFASALDGWNMPMVRAEP